MTTKLHAAASSETWAIEQSALASMLSTDTSARATQAARNQRGPAVQGAVVVIPVHGMISQRASIWQMLFGGTSTQQLGAVLSQLADDDRVSGVILDVDSPGGTVAGVSELADLIFEVRHRKQVAAISNSLNASAAYWISAQADPLVAAPGSDTGSVGVFRLHENIAGMLEKDGIEVTMIAEPEKKLEGNPYQPLTEEARQHHEQQVHATYKEFVEAVARGREVRDSVVRMSYGRGRVFHGKQAAEMGLVDRVATLPQLLGELGVPTGDAASNATGSSLRLQRELNAAWCAEQPRAAPTSTLDRRRRRVEKKMKVGAC